MRKWLETLLARIAGQALEIIADTILFAISAFCHAILDWFLGLMVPKGWDRAHLVIQEGVFVAFAIIYAVLLYDIVAAFIPYLKTIPRKQYELPFGQDQRGS
jgi:hypothetical protein